MFKLYNLRTLKYLLLFILLFEGFSPAQDSNIEEYQFISPLPDSKLIMPESNIIIRYGDIIDPATIYESSIEVIGSISGVHSGELFLSDDMLTLIFIPLIHFTPGEKVNVKLYSGILTTYGEMLSPLNFDFYISKTISKNVYEKVLCNVSDFPNSNANTKYDTYFLKSDKAINKGLPGDFPNITVSVNNNPSDGYLFLAPYSIDGAINYLSILDNNAVPIYFQRMPNANYDFKIQQNGLITYGSAYKDIFYVMDSFYELVDSFATGNGYSTDHHDFQIIDGGHSLLLAYDPQPVRMDTIVAGGDSSAIVIGLIIQELDETKNVIFQWRSWDHFNITDATEDIDLTQHTIDYVHGNAIEMDYDGHILISSRHLDEITKISRQTGEIIWRLGGKKSRNNQFQFTNDTITFSHQHDIRRLDNGNVTLYDNGNLHTPRESSAIEYELDEENIIATRIWRFSHPSVIFKKAMGNVQRLDNEHTIIGWGGWFNEDTRTITEVGLNNDIRLEFLMPGTFLSYRAFKFNWRTDLFVTNPDSIYFETVSVGDSATIGVDLINNSADTIGITGYYNLNEDFVVKNPVPFTLPAYGTVSLKISFIPTENGYVKDYLHIRSDTETSRKAQVMILAGSTDTIINNVKKDKIIYNYVLEQNYPNPFNPSTTIKYAIPHQSYVTVKIFNSIGENIEELVNKSQSAGSYQVDWIASNVASGIYFYSLEAVPTDGSNPFKSVRKMILLK